MGPHVLLYRQASTDFTQWVYLGRIFQASGGVSWSEWSGNWGWDLEVSTVLRLGTEGDQPSPGGRDVITLGASFQPVWARGDYSDQGQMVPEYAALRIGARRTRV